MVELEYGFSPAPCDFDDTALVSRVAAAYEASIREFEGHGTSFWGSFAEKHPEFIAALTDNDLDAFGRLLRDPSETELFWGFDDLCRQSIWTNNPRQCEEGAQLIHKLLLQVAIGAGAVNCHYPEANQAAIDMSTEEILSALDLRFGFRIDFPNPFRREFGLRTSRGVASYRVVQSIYQSWRISQIARALEGSRILEIGAGLGRNAYYAMKFGLTDFTIVDIPNTQMAQGYYLGRILGGDRISLNGEKGGPVRLKSPQWLKETREVFDVVLNVDSLTEMDREHALGYVRFARDRSRTFLSINHEFNPTLVRDLLNDLGMTAISRSPYWPRVGYVEELYIGALPYAADSLRSEIDALRGSRSWKITAPLRAVKGALLNFEWATRHGG